MTITILAVLIVAAAVLAVLWLPDALLRPVLALLDEDYAHSIGPTRTRWQHYAVAPVVALGTAVTGVGFLAFAICAWLTERTQVVLRYARLPPSNAALAGCTGARCQSR